MISREMIEEIIMRTDIESLIGSYVSLKRAGSNLKGLCPFHSEKSPSFTVYPASNSFYCFGCGVGGDAITFAKQIEHLDYPDAIQFLAKRAGINIIIDDVEDYQTKRVDKNRFYSMNVDAAKFFNRALFDNTPSAKNALSYFQDKRGLSISTIKHFGLGYAPDSFDSLIKYLTSKGYTKDELVENYLARKSEKGYYTDAFRNRVMFPIIDVSGNVIAFGGRALDKDSKMKYINSMDTPVFKKSRNLFALNFAKNNSSDSLILCEGYMDVIALHAAGFTNAVATLGTAITPEQARLMSRYTKKVIISYDSDEPGQKAAQKAMSLLGAVGIEVTVIKVPGAKDPDEYIKTYGKEKFADVLNNSKTKFEYGLENILSKYDINLMQDKKLALAELVKLISEVYSKAERDIYIKIVSEKFGVSFDGVRDDVERTIKKQSYKAKKDEAQAIRQDTAGIGDKVNRDFVKAPAVAKNEENLLGLLLLYPEHRKKVFGDGLVSSEDFFTEFNRRVFDFIKEEYLSGENLLPDFNISFGIEEVGRIQQMKLRRMESGENGDTVLNETIESLRTSKQKKDAESINTAEGLDALLASLKKQKKT